MTYDHFFEITKTTQKGLEMTQKASSRKLLKINLEDIQIYLSQVEPFFLISKFNLELIKPRISSDRVEGLLTIRR